MHRQLIDDPGRDAQATGGEHGHLREHVPLDLPLAGRALLPDLHRAVERPAGGGHVAAMPNDASESIGLAFWGMVEEAPRWWPDRFAHLADLGAREVDDLARQSRAERRRARADRA